MSLPDDRAPRPGGTGRPVPPLRGRVALSIVSALVLIVAVEVGAAVYRAMVCPGDAPTFSVPDARFGWLHIPSSGGHAYACRGREYEFSKTVAFNARGLNAQEFDHARTPGVSRVLVLGDSVTEALQVDRAENFTERTSARLASEGIRAEVINAGHAGYGTDNEVLFYEREGREYHPDVVVLVFNLQNDFAENSPEVVARMYAGGPDRPKAGLRLESDGSVAIDDGPLAKAVRDWEAKPWWRRQTGQGWIAHSFLVRRLARAWSSPTPTHTGEFAYPPQLDVYAQPVDADWARARSLTLALLRRLRSDVEADGAQLIVLLVPSREIAFPDQWSKLVTWFPALARKTWDLQQPRQWLAANLTASGLTTVDATDRFRRGREQAGVTGFLELDPHPDRIGHEWISDALIEPLRTALQGKTAAKP